jgi:hypothetical protein
VRQEIVAPGRAALRGRKSGNLGPIDSPAWRFHQLPPPRSGNGGRRAARELEDGENALPAAQAAEENRPMAWTSPIFVRRISGATGCGHKTNNNSKATERE